MARTIEYSEVESGSENESIVVVRRKGLSGGIQAGEYPGGAVYLCIVCGRLACGCPATRYCT